MNSNALATVMHAADSAVRHAAEKRLPLAERCANTAAAFVVRVPGHELSEAAHQVERADKAVDAARKREAKNARDRERRAKAKP
jgi:hypothetical protein